MKKTHFCFLCIKGPLIKLPVIRFKRKTSQGRTDVSASDSINKTRNKRKLEIPNIDEFSPKVFILL